MYNYVFNVSDKAKGESLTEEYISTLSGCTGTVTERDFDEYDENPLEGIEPVSDIEIMGKICRFSLSKDAIIRYLSDKYDEWKKLIEKTSLDDFVENGSHLMNRLHVLDKGNSDDIFIVCVDGQYYAESFHDFLRRQLSICNDQNMGEITLYVRQTFVCHTN